MKTAIEIADMFISEQDGETEGVYALGATLAQAYKDVTQWIPVGERLPEVSCRGEYGSWVLVNNGHHTGISKLVDWEDGENPEWEDECGEPITPPLTHWMPLPLPPINVG